MISSTTIGVYEVRFDLGDGKYHAQVYQAGKLTDTLSHPSLTELRAKVNRFLNAEEQVKLVDSMKTKTAELEAKIESMNQSFEKMGDSNARAASAENEVTVLTEKNASLEKQVAELTKKLEEVGNQLTAAEKPDKKK